MSALQLDALHNSHPIEVPVGHPSEIDEIFDDISYSKGASVIRMLHRYLGDGSFRAGMALYLKRHAYGNTQTEDLWAALGEASGKPVRDVMASWTGLKGFPLISVSQRQQGSDRVLSLSQSKFAADGRVPEAERSVQWMVPVSVVSSRSPRQAVLTTLLSAPAAEVVLPDTPAGQWLKLNQDSVGVFRVAYSPDMLHALLPAVQGKHLQPIDRLNLFSDLLALAQAGMQASTVHVMKLLQAMKKEDEYSVWSGIVAGLKQLDCLMQYTDCEEQYKEWCRRLLSPLFSKQIGWTAKPGEKHADALLRSAILERMVVYDESSVVAESQRRFAAHVEGSETIAADLRSVVYAAVAASASEEQLEHLFKMFRDTDQHEEKLRILKSLAHVRTNERLRRVLDFAISDDVRKQESVRAIACVAARSKAGRQLAWELLQQQEPLFLSRYSGMPPLAWLVSILCVQSVCSLLFASCY